MSVTNDIVASWRNPGKATLRHLSRGQSEAAGALGLRLNGPKVYGDTRIEDAWMGDGRAEVNDKTILDRLARLSHFGVSIEVDEPKRKPRRRKS